MSRHRIFLPALALAALLACAPPDAVGQPGSPQPARVLGHLGSDGRTWLGHGLKWLGEREAAHMALALTDLSRLGPGAGWFHPSKTLFDWDWLARRHGQFDVAAIARADFKGPPDLFTVLDRDRDGTLTPRDLDWWPKNVPGTATKGKPPRTGLDPFALVLLYGMLSGEVGSIWEGPRPGERAPDFTLPVHEGVKTISLADYRGKKPVVLIFGSFT